MSSVSRSPAPRAVRLALTLIYALIFYRLLLVFGALEGLLDVVRQAGEQVDDGGSSPGETVHLFGLDRGPRIPGSLGTPMLFFVLLPLLIVTRRLVRRGYWLAAQILLGFLAIRTLLILVRGPWNIHAACLTLLMGAIAALLLSPSAREWFEQCARWRAERASPHSTGSV